MNQQTSAGEAGRLRHQKLLRFDERLMESMKLIENKCLVNANLRDLNKTEVLSGKLDYIIRSYFHFF